MKLPEYTPAQVLKAVSDLTGISETAIKGTRRLRAEVQARQMVCVCLRRFTALSYPEMRIFLDAKSLNAVYMRCRAVEKQMSHDDQQAMYATVKKKMGRPSFKKKVRRP